MMAAPSGAGQDFNDRLQSEVQESSRRFEPRPRPLILPILVTSRLRPNKRLSPRLQVRFNLLEKTECRNRGRDGDKQLEEESEGTVGGTQPHQEVKQRGDERLQRRLWKPRPVSMPSGSGGVRLSGGPVVSEGEASLLDSDVSSVISLSDRLALSETEDEDVLRDKQKYRLPDPGKTRLHLLTKEPLSPTPRPAPRTPPRRPTTPTPTTPQAMQPNTDFQSPIWPSYSRANGSSESLSGNEVIGRSLSRPNSVYTLSRASLHGQLAHLMSLKLPDPDSLARKISAIPTSAEAAKALSDASEQIRIWISKASEVLNGLNAKDDVEWAAAGGKEGIDDVDEAMARFQNLVEVYVVSIERLQGRDDVSSLSADELQSSVKQMEGIVVSWKKVQEDLKGVKDQVEIAMEWEELWNSVLGEIAQEMDALNRLVFEMEERRHQGAESLLSSKETIDLHELETIVEERPGQGAPMHGRHLSLPGPFSPGSPVEPVPVNEHKDEASLLALFARMQPLRASLDFLPMRLSTFGIRGRAVFPTACVELDRRKDQLELQWKKLEADAESLRRELGEDRWIVVFRNAGRQALKMEESITRSYNKLKEAVDLAEHHTNASSFARKAESYEAKKVHYGPAIDRVLAIIDRGVQDRLTVNGEILRLQSDMRRRWTALQSKMQAIDLVLEEFNNDNEKQSRDSLSTTISSERSIASSLADTPGSSPASSVVGGASGNGSFHGSRTPTPLTNGKLRKTGLRPPNSIPKTIPLTQSGEFTAMLSSSPLASRISSNPLPGAASSSTPHRPRWQAATRTQNRDFLPLSALEPSPYAKPAVVKQTNFLRSSSNTLQTPPPNSSSKTLGRKISTPNFPSPSTTTTTPTPSTIPRASVVPNPHRKSALPLPTGTPSRPSLASRKSHSALRTSSHMLSTPRQSSVLVPPKIVDGNEADSESPAHHKRSSSSMSGGKRTSLLPRAKGMGAGMAATENVD